MIDLFRGNYAVLIFKERPFQLYQLSRASGTYMFFTMADII